MMGSVIIGNVRTAKVIIIGNEDNYDLSDAQVLGGKDIIIPTVIAGVLTAGIVGFLLLWYEVIGHMHLRKISGIT